MTLRDSENNTKAVLKFLLQWFDSNPVTDHAYDPLLIDQLGCIVISRAKNDVIYQEIMKKFKEIIKEASLAVSQGNVGKSALSKWHFFTYPFTPSHPTSPLKNEKKKCKSAKQVRERTSTRCARVRSSTRWPTSLPTCTWTRT